jgi:hypothetical protein
MAQQPSILAATLFVTSIIGWILLAERPQEIELGRNTVSSHSETDLRLISERSPYMRTERR